MTQRNKDTMDVQDEEPTPGPGNEAQDVRDAFVRILSHDLQNPLNVADLHLDLARRDNDNENLETVARALDRLDALVADLLQLAEGGQLVEEVKPVELREVAETCWETLLTEEATLVCDEECTIRADPAQLRQLLENLFLNAVEHGGDDVTVAVGCLDDEPGFYVEDDGAGIAVNPPPTVFEPGVSTASEGTGYGLYIVSVIAGAHGWEYRVTPGSDGGARFEFLTG